MALQLYLHNQKLSERKFVSCNGGAVSNVKGVFGYLVKCQ